LINAQFVKLKKEDYVQFVDILQEYFHFNLNKPIHANIVEKYFIAGACLAINVIVKILDCLNNYIVFIQ